MKGLTRVTLVLGVVVVGVLVWSGLAYAAPAATATPAVLAPTQTITVGGSGFTANAAIDVYWDTTDVALVLADGTGAFSGITVSVPSSALPGNHWVSLVSRHDGVGAQKLITVHTAWAQRAWSGFHRSLNPFENVLNPSNISGLEEDWTAASGPVQYGGAAVGSGARQVFFGDSTGVQAVSELTGATVWTRTLNGSIRSTPAVDSGRVYVHAGAAAGSVYALNATTGAILWQTSIGASNAFSSPTVVSNVIYVGADDHNLYALNGSTGLMIWKGSTGNPIYSSPAVSGGRVFVGSSDFKMYAFAVGCGSGGATCTPLWTTTLGDSVSSSPAVSNGIVYVGANNGLLYALSAARGAILWTGTLPQSADLNSPAVANGVVYMPSSLPGVLTAFPAACGTSGGSCSPLWQSPSYPLMEMTPAIANGVVYASASDSNGNTGWMLGFPASANCANPCLPSWTATTGGANTPPIVSDGTVLAGSSAGGLTAWDLPAATHAPPTPRPDPHTLRPDLTLKPTK